jgi:hypothetical protein
VGILSVNTSSPGENKRLFFAGLVLSSSNARFRLAIGGVFNKVPITHFKSLAVNNDVDHPPVEKEEDDDRTLLERGVTIASRRLMFDVGV